MGANAGDRIAVLADLHANRIALEAVLEDMPPVDGLVCAGDVVGYNPWPGACVDRMREFDVPTVMGNHDRAVVTGDTRRLNRMATAGVEHARAALDDDARGWLRGLPDEREYAGGRVKIVHGHPDDPDHYTMPREFSSVLLGDEDVLVMGHTHVQYHEAYETGIAMNPGSVGQPRDGDPRAAYAVVDLDGPAVDERRVRYDVERVIDAVRDAGLPASVGRRLREGR